MIAACDRAQASRYETFGVTTAGTTRTVEPPYALQSAISSRIAATPRATTAGSGSERVSFQCRAPLTPWITRPVLSRARKTSPLSRLFGLISSTPWNPASLSNSKCGRTAPELAPPSMNAFFHGHPAPVSAAFAAFAPATSEAPSAAAPEVFKNVLRSIASIV